MSQNPLNKDGLSYAARPKKVYSSMEEVYQDREYIQMSELAGGGKVKMDRSGKRLTAEQETVELAKKLEKLGL